MNILVGKKKKTLKGRKIRLDDIDKGMVGDVEKENT